MSAEMPGKSGLHRLSRGLGWMRFAGMLPLIGLIATLFSGYRDLLSASLAAAAILLVAGTLTWFRALGRMRMEGLSPMGRRYLSFSRATLLLIPAGALSLLDPSVEKGLMLASGSALFLFGVALAATCLALREMTRILGYRFIGSAQAGSSIYLVAMILLLASIPFAIAAYTEERLSILGNRLTIAFAVNLFLFRFPIGWMRESAESLKNAKPHEPTSDREDPEEEMEDRDGNRS